VAGIEIVVTESCQSRTIGYSISTASNSPVPAAGVKARTISAAFGGLCAHIIDVVVPAPQRRICQPAVPCLPPGVRLSRRSLR
jgi:hypothetical protein